MTGIATDGGPRPRIELASFDLDGTLVDTASEIAEAANLALEVHGVERVSAEEIVMLVGRGAHALMRALLAKLAAERPDAAIPEDIDAVLATYDETYARTTGTTGANYVGARDSLDRLRSAGVRLACVTNKEAHHAHRVLEVNGLLDAFELVVGGDSLPQRKPHPSVLETVAGRFGVPLEAVVHVGDSSTDVEAAKAAGVAAWAVPYGYNAGRPIEEAGPDRVFGTLREVADAVLESRDTSG